MTLLASYILGFTHMFLWRSRIQSAHTLLTHSQGNWYCAYERTCCLWSGVAPVPYHVSLSKMITTRPIRAKGKLTWVSERRLENSTFFLSVSGMRLGIYWTAVLGRPYEVSEIEAGLATCSKHLNCYTFSSLWTWSFNNLLNAVLHLVY